MTDFDLFKLGEALPFNQWKDLQDVCDETDVPREDVISLNEVEYLPATNQVRRVETIVTVKKYKKVSKSDQPYKPVLGLSDDKSPTKTTPTFPNQVPT
jgi:hypothetical protein